MSLLLSALRSLTVGISIFLRNRKLLRFFALNLAIFENIDIDIDIDKKSLENININIDKAMLKNIDIDIDKGNSEKN